MAKKDSKKASIYKSVAGSSKLEGIDFEEALKDKELIKKLKAHGRAFSV